MKFYIILISAVYILMSSVSLAQWEPDQRLTDDPANSFLCGQQCLVAEGDTLHVIFTDNRRDWYDVYYIRSTDAGITWDSAVRISPGDSNRIFGATVAASGADVHVVWEGRNSSSLRYRRSTDGGTIWLPETALVVSRSCGSPYLSTDGGRVGLAWCDSRDGNWNGELYYKQSSDGGRNWTADARLTVDVDSTLDKEACLVVAGTNRYLVWTRVRWRTGATQTWFMRSTDGGASWLPRSRIADDPTEQNQPMVAAARNNVHVCWYDGRPGGYGIWYRGSTDNGATWNAEQYLADTIYASDYPCIAAAGGNVHVAYRACHSGQFVTKYRGSTDNGRTWSAETTLTTVVGMGTANLTATGSRVHLLFYDNREGNFEIYHKRNLAAGGVAETPNTERRTPNTGPSVVRGVLRLARDTSSSWLLDAAGRIVIMLRPGENDVSHLAPGVYFVRTDRAGEESGGCVVRVVIPK